MSGSGVERRNLSRHALPIPELGARVLLHTTFYNLGPAPHCAKVAVDDVDWCAFRIHVRKAGRHAYDFENVLKPIIDAFCAMQIRVDGSEFANLALYPDDAVDHVRVFQVDGARSDDADSTSIEILGHLARGAA